ncbi:MAG: HlyD family secretion protein, partial [Burkholderiales bacterium]
ATLDAAVSAERNAAARVAEFQATLKSADLAAREDALLAADQEVQAAEAALAQVRWSLTRKAARAPATGLVEQIYYRRGEWVATGAPVLALLPPENRILRFYVPEPVLGDLQIGQAVRVHCDGCATEVNATIRYISPRAEFTPPVIYSNERRERLLFMIEAAPAPADALKLKPGQPVDVELAHE